MEHTKRFAVEAYFIKLPNSTLVPASDNDREMLSRIRIGDPVKLTFTRSRNYKFLKKYFSLLNLAFDFWEPPEHGEGSAWKEKIPVEKNFETFRHDIAILAGYYNATYRINGDIRFEAKSIAFANMSEDDFEKLYSASINVILKNIMHNYTEAELRQSVEGMILSYA